MTDRGSNLADSAVVIEDLSVHIAGKPLLVDINLTLSRTGVTWLLGPVAAGKSTFLRVLAGRFHGQPNFFISGNIEVRVDRGLAFGLVTQNVVALLASPLSAVITALSETSYLPIEAARELATVALIEAGLEGLLDSTTPVAELPLGVQRRVALARASAANPVALLVDEPTRNLDEAERDVVLRHLARLSQHTALLVVTHDRRDVAALPGRVALLAGGTLQETCDSDIFLGSPRSEAGRRYLETGSVQLPSPGADPLDIGDQPPPAPWLKWASAHCLAGMPRPGLLRDLEHEIKVLHRWGATLLVCLEETVEYDVELLRLYGIQSVHRPIPDMAAAGPEALAEVAALLRAHIARGAVAVVHCKAGLGRTGMVLAASLIAGGASCAAAVAQIRAVEPRFIQTEGQLKALSDFEHYLTNLVPDE